MTRDAYASCPSCLAPRVEGPDCPRCGVVYAKAHPRRPVAPDPSPAEEVPGERPGAVKAPAAWSGELEAAEKELKIRVFALPVALVAAKVVMGIEFLHALARIALSMWVHELGHAVTAWFCGLAAFPGPWLTPVADTRGPLTPALLFAALARLAWTGHRRRRRSWVILAGGLFALQLVGTLALSNTTAHLLVIFGGDGGGLVLGSLLMCTMYADADTQLHRGWLRWGFLVIGAVACADVFSTWWAARSDYADIPFGENEGVGLSDASRLVDTYGWGAREMILRYLRLAAACGVGLAAAYVAGLVQARRRLAGRRPTTTLRG